MENSDYINSYLYEGFITLARLCDRDKFGAHHQNMLSLIWSEQDNSSVNNMSQVALLNEVKNRMATACTFFLTRKVDKEDKQKTKQFIKQINTAQSSELLLSICEEGITVFEKYKPSS